MAGESASLRGVAEVAAAMRAIMNGAYSGNIHYHRASPMPPAMMRWRPRRGFFDRMTRPAISRSVDAAWTPTQKIFAVPLILSGSGSMDSEDATPIQA